MQFIKPAQLNGVQLKEELEAAGIEIPFVTDKADGFIYFDVEKSKESTAVQIVANHIAVDKSAQNATAKATLLAQLNITEEQAKLLLS